MRKTYVEDPETGSWISKEEYLVKYPPGERSAMIMPDIPDFQSPIDGRVVNGRAGLRAHNKHHNVTNVADYTNTWKKAADERAKAYTPGAGYDSIRRKEHIIRSIEQLRRR